jgi:hypothetical protein
MDMNIRKVLAGGMAAIAAGATVAFGAFAQSSDLGAYVDSSGSTPVPPWIILGSGNGSPDYAKDVLGASDVAAGMAGFATRDRAIGGAAEVSVSGGVGLSTANTKIFGGDSINTAKDTLTSDDLPSILASGTFEDSDGNSYDYDQYIVVGDSTVGLSLSNSDDVLGDDPATLIDIGTTAGDPAYTLRIIFNDDLNFSNSDVGSNTIDLFGTSYTISSDSDADTLILFGGANKQTLTEGETVTVDVGGVSYEVSLIGVSDSNTVIVQVDSVSRTIDEGNSRKISNLEVYVEEVYYLSKESQTSSAKLSFGSSRLTFDDADEVSVGTGSDAEDIDNTLVTFTQGSEGTSVLEIDVAAPDSDGDFAAEDMPFTDPVFGTFKLAFGGATPGLTERALFEFDTSGDDTAIVSFTEEGGESATVEFGYDSAPGTDNDAITLADSDGDEIVVVEGQNITEDDYVVINQDDFSHLLECTDIDASTGDSDPTVTFKDVFSGTNYEIQLTESGSTGVFNGTKVIDGKTYIFLVDSNPSTDIVAVVWDDDTTSPAVAHAASASVDVGNTTSVFPTIVAEQGAELAFVNNVSEEIGTNLNGTMVEILGIEVVLEATTTELTGTNIQYTYSQDGWLTLEGINIPSVAVLEEEGEDTSGNDLRNAVVVQTGDDSDGITIATGTGTPIFSDAVQNALGWLGTSDNDIDVTADRYGTFVSKNTDSSDQGSVEVYYPDNQVVMAVGIGANPVFSVSGESGTVQEAYQITTPVAKLASEVTGASLTRDAIIFGGPCANALVAELMGVSMDWPDCFADFESLDEGMIAEYDDAFGSGQKALVIAGVTGDDTRALAAKVLAGTMDYSA